MSATFAAVEGDRLSSMFVFFFIALLIVSPFGYQRIRAVMRERRATAGGDLAALDDAGVGDRAGTRPAPVGDLSHVVAAIGAAAQALAADPGSVQEVELPADPLVEGRPAPAPVVEAIVGDAVRRAGLTPEWIDEGTGSRRLRLTTSG